MKRPGTGAWAAKSANSVAMTAAPGQAGERQEGSFTWFLVKLLLAVLLLRIFIVAPFSIPSESMMPNLLRGDFLIAAKWPYGWSRLSVPFDLPLIPGRIKPALPERGDVVIFQHPVDDADYIKRVIGLPGDTVEVRGGVPVINGRALSRQRVGDYRAAAAPYLSCAGGALAANAQGVAECAYPMFRETLPGGRSYDVLDFGTFAQDDFGAVTVPPGKLFVMGDNRDNSQDSRFPAQAGGGVGLVDQDLLVARAGMIAFSIDGSAQLSNPLTWLTAVRWNRTGERL